MISRVAQFSIVGQWWFLKKKKKNFGGCPVAFGPTAVVRAPRAWGVYKPLQRCHWFLKKKKKKKSWGVSGGIQLPLIPLRL